MRDFTRMLIAADGHSGHLVGLTPPGFDTDKPPRKFPECWHMRRTIWNWYDHIVKKLAPIDIQIYNGDAIDGRGEKSGSLELLYVDRGDQCEMAATAIRWAQARQVVMTYGTAYHTGSLEDWENDIAKDVNAVKIGGEDTLDINGFIINYRHHVSRSTVPHGRFTAPAREKLWNDLWAQRGEYPQAKMLVRSHVHYHVYCGTHDWVAVTTPALQGYGTKFGTRRMTGTVDIGLISVDITKTGVAKWKAHILRLPLKEPLSL